MGDKGTKLQTIAEAIWEYDRANNIRPCIGVAFTPIALPELALGTNMNSAHYGTLAKHIITKLEEARHE